MNWRLLAALLFAVEAEAAPKLVLDPPHVLLGVVEGDQKVPYSNLIRNEGDETLHIEEVSTTCGCTVALLADSTVPPGGAVSITGHLETRKLEGDVRKHVFLRSNDPSRERAVLLIRAWVVRGLSWYPTKVLFANAPAGEGRERRIIIRSGDDIPLRIVGVTGDTQRFSWELVDADRKGDYYLNLTLLPQPAGTAIHDTIIVRTNVKEKETIRIPVIGNIGGRTPQRGKE